MTAELRRADLRRDSLLVLRHLERWEGRASYGRLVDHLVRVATGFTQRTSIPRSAN